MVQKIFLANPRGFCAGVSRAVAAVDVAVSKFGVPLYVRHAIVHNRTIVANFASRGVIFVERLSDVPRGGNVVLSAHGSPLSVFREAEARELNVIDATCPLVDSVHSMARAFESKGLSIVLIGQPYHAEVVGTVGQVSCPVSIVGSVDDIALLEVYDPTKVGYITQTTLNVDDAAEIITALKIKFPGAIGPRDGNICYATKNRQDAAKAVASKVDVMIIVGSLNSSNSNKLRDVCMRYTTTHLIDSCNDLVEDWFTGVTTVGISAGASAPEFLVEDVVKYLSDKFPGSACEFVSGAVENMSFGMPKGLL